jgi:hypothetical protein
VKGTGPDVVPARLLQGHIFRYQSDDIRSLSYFFNLAFGDRTLQDLFLFRDRNEPLSMRNQMRKSVTAEVLKGLWNTSEVLVQADGHVFSDFAIIAA